MSVHLKMQSLVVLLLLSLPAISFSSPVVNKSDLLTAPCDSSSPGNACNNPTSPDTTEGSPDSKEIDSNSTDITEVLQDSKENDDNITDVSEDSQDSKEINNNYTNPICDTSNEQTDNITTECQTTNNMTQSGEDKIQNSQNITSFSNELVQDILIKNQDDDGTTDGSEIHVESEQGPITDHSNESKQNQSSALTLEENTSDEKLINPLMNANSESNEVEVEGNTDLELENNVNSTTDSDKTISSDEDQKNEDEGLEVEDDDKDAAADSEEIENSGNTTLSLQDTAQPTEEPGGETTTSQPWYMRLFT